MKGGRRKVRFILSAGELIITVCTNYLLVITLAITFNKSKATEVTTKPGEGGRLVDGKVLDWLPLLVEFFWFPNAHTNGVLNLHNYSA